MVPARKPLLIVPIRDRRQRRRLLTIRNCAITMLSLAVLVATVSVVSESRRGAAGDYGRLFGSQVPAPTSTAERRIDVITEGPVSDQASSDPMLIAPAARAQLLLANSNVPPPPTPTAPPAPVQVQTTAPLPLLVPAPVLGSALDHGATIVGDGNGVTVVKAPETSTDPRPVLTGGIFKQH